ncbi:hypothetical protein INR49_016523, partial [Caranx melampygus]
LSFQRTWPHISPDACCDRPTIPDTPPSSFGFPSPPKIERSSLSQDTVASAFKVLELEYARIVERQVLIGVPG